MVVTQDKDAEPWELSDMPDRKRIWGTRIERRLLKGEWQYRLRVRQMTWDDYDARQY